MIGRHGWIAGLAGALPLACTFGSMTGEMAASLGGDTGETTAVDATSGGADDAPDPSAAASGESSSGGSFTTSTTEGPGDDTGCGAPQPWYPDADGDGYGDPKAPVTMACDTPPGHAPNPDDCDDTTSAVNPGLDEICDDLDNDCDDAIDEWSPANASCGDCQAVVEGDAVYYFCTGAMTWDAALAECEPKGATLVRIESDDENDFVAAGIHGRAMGDSWIGLRWDGSTWRWTDGTAIDYDKWRPLAPDFSGDCVEIDTLDLGQWNDLECAATDSTVGYVCEAPA